MHRVEESLAAWATVVGTIVSIIGLIQSRAWLAGISALFVAFALAAGLYARRKRLLLKSAELKVEGQSIDSLNIANLRRQITRSLVVQEARHQATIEGENLTIEWEYSGYCRADQETAIKFSIDSDNFIPFERLDCFAYDLQHDPGRKHKIRPLLLGTDGTSKKMAVPFLEPITAQRQFKVLLKCELPGCMTGGIEYYTSTLSFAQDRVPRCTVRLLFVGTAPKWLRVYECAPSGSALLLKSLQPLNEHPEFSEYLDVAEDRAGQSARIYVFSRSRV